MNFVEIAEKLKNLLKQPINEMSKAFSVKNRSFEVCAWVEGPLGVDNRYFKYYDSDYYSTASKVARIRIDKPVYVGGIHKEKNLKKWVLTNKEKQELIEILNQPSKDYNGFTHWQDILITYNRDNFNLSVNDTINGNFENVTCDPRLAKYIKPFPINYPMPDYLQL